MVALPSDNPNLPPDDDELVINYRIRLIRIGEPLQLLLGGCLIQKGWPIRPTRMISASEGTNKRAYCAIALPSERNNDDEDEDINPKRPLRRVASGGDYHLRAAEKNGRTSREIVGRKWIYRALWAIWALAHR